jgi:uncharacterized protein YdeI (YjbR/CyaY-like superfamily)
MPIEAVKSRHVTKIPAELASTLARDAGARTAFDAMPPSHQRRYCDWIDEAKKPETRAKRVEKSLVMMKEWQTEMLKKVH